jgi:hypothetical protein
MPVSRAPGKSSETRKKKDLSEPKHGKKREEEGDKNSQVCARSYAVSFIIPKPPPPGLSILILPNGFQVNVATPFCTAYAPPLPLVFGAKCHCATTSRQIQAAPSFCIRCVSSIRRLSHSLQLGLSFCFKRLLFGVGRVRDGFQTRNTGAARPQRRWR